MYVNTEINHYKEQFSQMVRELQNQITKEMQSLDGGLQLQEDLWERKDFIGNPGGGGITRAFKGEVFENAGVNTSCVMGKIDPQFAQKLHGKSDELWASGISLIIHPYNPRVPTVHANFRMIQQGEKVWFGGGADLTPFYPYPEDFKYFHKVWKEACAPYHCYESMKKKCDEYFVNPHRGGEMRGIGGIFFDHHNTGNLENDYSMVKELSSHFIRSYFPLVNKRMKEDFTKEDEEFQLHRRGRYVEFNLLHDRGTLFGLRTNGRVDSILISLPARVCYTYKYKPQGRSAGEEMNKLYWPRDW